MDNSKQKDMQLQTLIEEYKEMRNEIRAAYSQYFSILFGVILTGIGATFHLAFNNKCLFLLIPVLICGWLAIITFITSNIQHISNYIKVLEKKVNEVCECDICFYETSHVKKLWYSRIFIFTGLIACIPIIIVHIISIYKGFEYLSSHPIAVYKYIPSMQNYIFLVFSGICTVITVCLFLKVPTSITKRQFNKATYKIKEDYDPAVVR